MHVLRALAWSQQRTIEPVRPPRPSSCGLICPVTVPPVRLANSERLSDLIRAGKLYLTAQDAIALALENNIDIEVARYNRSAQRMAAGARPGGRRVARRSQRRFAGLLGGQRPGRAGSQQAAGVSGGGGNGSGSNSSNASISQVGPVTAILDPGFPGNHHLRPSDHAPAEHHPESHPIPDLQHPRLHRNLPAGLPDRRPGDGHLQATTT